MRRLVWIIVFFLLVGCSNDDLSYISIRNNTSIPIYALPYAAEYTNGEWIQPGLTDEFYSINCDCLDGYEYFSFFYDSLIIYIQGYDEDPVKFYKNGRTVNYDPTLNPFTNPEVWNLHEFERHLEGSSFESLQEKRIFEHYFSLETDHVKSLSDTLIYELNPAL
jgi:hypothetical protein